jgi:hypothetical protein
MSVTNGGIPTTQGFLQPVGFARVFPLTVATALPAAPAGTKVALIQAEAQNVRWRDDGVNPTAATGMVMTAGDSMIYSGDLSAIRFIESVVGANLNVTFYR